MVGVVEKERKQATAEVDPPERVCHYCRVESKETKRGKWPKERIKRDRERKRIIKKDETTECM